MFDRVLDLPPELISLHQHNETLEVYGENNKTHYSICPILLLFPICLITEIEKH